MSTDIDSYVVQSRLPKRRSKPVVDQVDPQLLEIFKEF